MDILAAPRRAWIAPDRAWIAIVLAMVLTPWLSMRVCARAAHRHLHAQAWQLCQLVSRS